MNKIYNNNNEIVYTFTGDSGAHYGLYRMYPNNETFRGVKEQIENDGYSPYLNDLDSFITVNQYETIPINNITGTFFAVRDVTIDGIPFSNICYQTPREEFGNQLKTDDINNIFMIDKNKFVAHRVGYGSEVEDIIKDVEVGCISIDLFNDEQFLISSEGSNYNVYILIRIKEPEPEPEPEPETNNLLIIGIVGVILLIGIIAFLFVTSRNKNKRSEVTKSIQEIEMKLDNISKK